jgi:hypothetical protein
MGNQTDAALTYPAHLPPDNEVTAWILRTVDLNRAGLALVLTPGARWFVAPEKLMADTSAFLQLQHWANKWDKAVWLVRQFEKSEPVNPGSIDKSHFDSWTDALNSVHEIEKQMDAIIGQLS